MSIGEPRPFSINIPDETLSRIRERVKAYRWFDPPAGPGEATWAHGMSTAHLREITDYWLASYDWRAAEAELNTQPAFKQLIDGRDIHYLHIKGEADGRRPLLITHGWPGSFYEFWDCLGPLAYPSRYGGTPEDAFDLVIPSLPGYAFSDKPETLFGPRATAALWDKLMRDGLGYDSYLAQGGDWGSVVTSWLGVNHGAHNGKGGCRAIHLNMMALRPTPASPQSEAESDWLTRTGAAMQAEGSYFMQQATKPQTLSFGLMDSPIGQAAWILEKFHGWSDLTEKDLFAAYSKDQLLTNLMLYLVNDAFATSVRFYQSFLAEGGAALLEGVRCETPTGFAEFPGETFLIPPPQSWADRAYNLTHWNKMPHGGHFAAMEAPELFVEEVRAWGRGQ